MKPVYPMIGLAFLGACLSVQAQEQSKPEQARRGARRIVRDDERAVGALVEAFTKAFNAGDAAAIAATFTQGALVVDEDGERTLGRAAIRDQFAASFKENPGQHDRPRGQLPEVPRPGDGARGGEGDDHSGQGGRGPRDHPASSPSTSRKTATGSRPPCATNRRATSPPTTVSRSWSGWSGEWVNESQDAVVFTTCKWADNGNFLVREFTVQMQGKPVMSGSQRIGWDPVKRQFKSWVFDSEGGFVEAYWTRDGNQWLVKAEGVGQDGEPATATNIITRLGKDRVGWQSVNRTLGGAAVPGVDEFILVRKPPEIGK